MMVFSSSPRVSLPSLHLLNSDLEFRTTPSPHLLILTTSNTCQRACEPPHSPHMEGKFPITFMMEDVRVLMSLPEPSPVLRCSISLMHWLRTLYYKDGGDSYALLSSSPVLHNVQMFLYIILLFLHLGFFSSPPLSHLSFAPSSPRGKSSFSGVPALYYLYSVSQDVLDPFHYLPKFPC